MANNAAAGKSGSSKGPVKNTETHMTMEEAAKRQKDAPREAINKADNSFVQEALEAHNRIRKKHGAPALVADEDLTKVAQAYANKLAKGGENFGYSGNGFGENVFFTTEGPVDGKMPVNAWYTESRRFDWNNVDKQKGTSHFTQMIWKGTKKMGIALAASKIGMWCVCNYHPPGNIPGQYANNIAKAK